MPCLLPDRAIAIRRLAVLLTVATFAALLSLAWFGTATARAGTNWEEDWSTSSQKLTPNPPTDKWNLHTYNPPERGGTSPDSYSFGASGDVYSLVMQGVSWGIESKQAFNKDTPIDVECEMKIQPTNASTDQYFGGITIYDGESGFIEIALADNHATDPDGRNGLRALAVINDVSTTLPDAPNFHNSNLDNNNFYKLRIIYDGRGTTKFYVNDNLLWTNTGSALPSNPDLFLLSVAQYLNLDAWKTYNTPYQARTEFRKVKVNGYYNLFSNTTHVNLLEQDNQHLDTNTMPFDTCGYYQQCDYLQLANIIDNKFYPKGSTVSPLITVTPGMRWGEVLTTTALNGQRITIQVLNPDGSAVSDQYLPGNAAGFNGSSVNLSVLDPDLFPSLKLQATFYTYDNLKTPRLLDWTLTFSNRAYFTWYDQLSPNMRDWLLASHPNNFGGEAHFWAQLGNPPLQTAYMASTHGKAAYAMWPGAMGGPVAVNKLSGLPAVVSQRVLFGNSLEETLAINEDRLSSHYHWTWYDELSPGYKNWVLIANPSSSETVTAIVSFTDKESGAPVTGTYEISPGQNVTADFPGKMGGPVEVRAYKQGGAWSNLDDHRKVIASQRVTSGNGVAFNEVPGIPDEELFTDYHWTWYDNFSAGATNWVLIANPNPGEVTYEIKIGGNSMTTGTLRAGETVAPTFPGNMGGPVEVISKGGSVIASQRSTWGSSFEETPGYPGNRLAADYQWTWYDSYSPGATNWIVIANLDSTAVSAEVYVGGALKGVYQLTAAGTTGAMKPVLYAGLMGGPVEVRAYRQGGSWSNVGDRRNVLASQRVLWNDFFNEVEGTVLNLD